MFNAALINKLSQQNDYPSVSDYASRMSRRIIDGDIHDTPQDAYESVSQSQLQQNMEATLEDYYHNSANPISYLTRTNKPQRIMRRGDNPPQNVKNNTDYKYGDDVYAEDIHDGIKMQVPTQRLQASTAVEGFTTLNGSNGFVLSPLSIITILVIIFLMMMFMTMLTKIYVAQQKLEIMINMLHKR